METSAFPRWMKICKKSSACHLHRSHTVLKPVCNILAQILTRKHFSLSSLMALEQVNLTLRPWKKNLTTLSHCDKNKKFRVDTVLTKSSWSHTVIGILHLNISCLHYSNCHAVQTRNQTTNIQKTIRLVYSSTKMHKYNICLKTRCLLIFHKIFI